MNVCQPRVTGAAHGQTEKPRLSARRAAPVTAGFTASYEKNSSLRAQLHVYLITFSCYGTHLPGDATGSYDHVRKGDRRFIAPNQALEQYHRRKMRQPAYQLSTADVRETVRDAIVEVCRFRQWNPCALHVRTTHVHALIEADSATRSVTA